MSCIKLHASKYQLSIFQRPSNAFQDIIAEKRMDHPFGYCSLEDEALFTKAGVKV